MSLATFSRRTRMQRIYISRECASCGAFCLMGNSEEFPMRQKEQPRHRSCSSISCGRRDLNPHDIAATRSLVLLVYQFRHFRTICNYCASLCKKGCGRRDLNPHDIAATRSLVLLVYQFRHFRICTLPVAAHFCTRQQVIQ